MNTEYFPHFVKVNYPHVKHESNDSLVELGDVFKTYLKNKFAGKMDKLIPIWDIDPKTVVMNQINKEPFTVNGYHPALILHFTDFVNEMKKEALKENI